MPRATALGVLCLGAVVAWSLPAEAGGGPENVFLVVNARSWASKRVGNEYVAARGIPPNNVFHLDYGAYLDELPTSYFRTLLLEPILGEIRRRGLANQIDYVVYSTDFPYRFNVAEDLRGRDLPSQVGPYGSLTGLTYLHQQSQRGDGDYAGLEVAQRRHANRYYRGEAVGETPRVGTLGFHSWYGFAADGRVLEAGGSRYLLSTMLGVTLPRGNSVEEILAYLRRGVAADGSQPEGVIYYVASNDVRTRARRGASSGANDRFAAAARLIEAEGVAARVVSGDGAPADGEIAGLMLGRAGFHWPAAAALAPGAIAEHFTSFGGVFTEGRAASAQMPLTVLLGRGAAGASGTVAEPMSFYQKFPSSTLHVHYVRGCSLAEAFYQSVASPYQLLVVGDPLCQPWATIPQVTVEGAPADGRVRGVVRLTPRVGPADLETQRVELYIDGVRRALLREGTAIDFPTDKLTDGSHELRFVAVARGPIQTQGSAMLRVWCENHGKEIEFAVNDESPGLGDEIAFAVRSEGASRWELRSQGNVIAEIEGEQGRATIAASRLGQGPVAVQAIAYAASANDVEDTAAEERELVRSEPLALQIGPPEKLTGAAAPRRRRAGVLLTADGVREVVESTAPVDWLRAAGVGPFDQYQIRGGFSVASASVYQFVVAYKGALELRVDGSVVYSASESPFEFHYVPVSLTAGVHSLQIDGRTGEGSPVLYLRFGGAGVRSLSGDQFWHDAS